MLVALFSGWEPERLAVADSSLAAQFPKYPKTLVSVRVHVVTLGCKGNQDSHHPEENDLDTYPDEAPVVHTVGEFRGHK